MKKKLVGLLAAFMLVAAFFVTSASPAHASTKVYGSVECGSGHNIEGLWVAASSGTSGWAIMNYPGNTHYNISWSYTLSSGNSYSVHVGCGGTPGNWAVTSTSEIYSGNSYNLICHDGKPSGLPPAYWYRCA